jgi:glycolate oxidase
MPKEVSKIMKLAFLNNIPVTPIGARTGLSGGSLSIHGGIGFQWKDSIKY